MADRLLAVYLENVHIGDLSEGGGIWRYSYDPDWLASPTPFAIGPGLPLGPGSIVDQGTLRPVQWYFDNLLPEEALRERLAKERRIEAADAFGLLEAYGSESAGSLTLLAPGAALPAAGRRPLPDKELAARIRDLPRFSLEAKAPKKMSLAGAQHKLALIVDGDAMFEPEGAEPSTHILKPDHRDPDAYPNSTANEWFTMQLAARLGLPVPTSVHRYCPDPIYIVERFDRTRTDAGTRRLHLIDACQLLSLDRAYKYQAMSQDALLNIAAATRSRAVTRVRLFRWCAFNALVGNADAHLKNLSFIVRSGGIELAPFYDLVSTAVFDAPKPAQWGTVKMSLQIGEATRFDEVSRDTLIDLGTGLQISKDASARSLDQMARRMPEEADKLIAEFEARDFPKAAVASRGGELRVLRQIRHVVIKEMCQRALVSKSR